MKTQFKQRIAGLLVIVSLGFIFIPEFIKEDAQIVRPAPIESLAKPVLVLESKSFPELKEIKPLISPSELQAKKNAFKDTNESDLVEANEDVVSDQSESDNNLKSAKATRFGIAANVDEQNTLESDKANELVIRGHDKPGQIKKMLDGERSLANELMSADSNTDYDYSKAKQQANEVASKSWILQVGAFSSEDNALKLKQKLEQAGHRAKVKVSTDSKGKRLHKVFIGPVIRKYDLVNQVDELKENLSLNPVIIRYIP